MGDAVLLQQPPQLTKSSKIIKKRKQSLQGECVRLPSGGQKLLRFLKIMNVL